MLHIQTDWIDVCNHPAGNQTDAKLRESEYQPGDVVKVVPRGAEGLEEIERLQTNPSGTG